MSGPELRFAPRQWLENVHGGLIMLLGSCVIGIFAMTCVPLGVVSSLGLEGGVLVTALFGAFAILFGCGGIAATTPPEPGSLVRGDKVRICARYAAGAPLAATVLAAARLTWALATEFGNGVWSCVPPMFFVVASAAAAIMTLEHVLCLRRRFHVPGRGLLLRVAEVLFGAYGLTQCLSLCIGEAPGAVLPLGLLCLLAGCACALLSLIGAVRGATRELKAGDYLRAHGFIT